MPIKTEHNPRLRRALITRHISMLALMASLVLAS